MYWGNDRLIDSTTAHRDFRLKSSRGVLRRKGMSLTKIALPITELWAGQVRSPASNIIERGPVPNAAEVNNPIAAEISESFTKPREPILKSV